MKIVKLYGHLGKTFGRVHLLDVRTPAEAVRALSANFPDFKKYLITHSEPGYRVLLNKTSTVELHYPIDTQTISIVPVVAGGGKFFGVILGVALIVAAPGLATTPLFGIAGLTASGIASQIGVSLVLTGVSSLLFAPPKPQAQDGEKGPKRNYFNGPLNLSQQGNPVPLAYGQITVGSQVAHARIRTPVKKNNKVFTLAGVVPQGTAYETEYASLSEQAIKTQRAEIIDIISEGEIEGLVNAEQSVYLDGVPIKDAEGNFNTAGGSSFEIRTGTQSQTPVFTALSGVAVTKSNPTVSEPILVESPQQIVITDTNTKLVEITLGTPALYEIGKSGKFYASTISLFIDVGVLTGGSIDWKNIVTDKIYGDYRSLYQAAWEVPIDVPASNYPVYIRVRRLTTAVSNANFENKLYFYNYTERSPTRLAYPNTALVNVNLVAKEFSSIPSRSYNIKGIKVLVPNNYNPITRVYTGNWSGEFSATKVWTDNPVWIYYDLLTNKRYGLGELLTTDQIDKWALYKISKYCDELVSDGSGGTEPRYTCNMYIQSQEEAYKVLNNLTSIFRGINYWADGQMTVIADSPSEPIAEFSPANVINGMFNYSGSSLKARRNVVLVTWNDPQDFYRQKIEYVEDAGDSAAIARMSRFGISQTEVIAVGCTSRGQANRVGKWLLYTEQKETESITFRAGMDSAIVSPGEIIQTNDPTRAGERLGGRIVSVVSNTIELDADIPAGNYSLYIFVPYKDSTGTNKPKLESRTGVVSPAGPGLTYGRNFIASSAFTTTPAINAIWVAARTNDLQPELWRVISIKEEQDSTVEISAIAHDPNKFAAVEQNLILPVRDTTSLNYAAPQAPSNLNFSEYLYLISPGNISIGAKVDWASVDPTVNTQFSSNSDFIFRYALTNAVDEEDDLLGDWVEIRTNTPNVDIKPLEQGVYSIELNAVNSLGRKSTTYSTSITILGKAIPPSAVETISANIVSSGVQLTWTAVTDLDLEGYEIRKVVRSTSSAVTFPFKLVDNVVGWDPAATTVDKELMWNSLVDSKVQSGLIYETSYLDLVPTAGFPIYLIKSKDTSNNYSSVANLYGLEITKPVTVTGLTYLLDNSDIVIRWTAPFSVFGISKYVVNLDGVDYEVANTEFRRKATWSGGAARNFSVTAYDSYNTVGDTATGTITIETQSVPLNLNYELNAGYVDIYWDLPSNGINSLDLAYYELRTDTNWGTSVNLVSSQLSTTHSILVNWTGTKVFYLAAFDSLNNPGVSVSLSINIANTSEPRNVSTSVVDNNVLLFWEEPSTVPLPIVEYEIRRGSVWETAELIGTKSGNFTSVFETVSGNYTYLIAAVSTAKKANTVVPYGAVASITAKVNQPPDYVLQDNFFSSFTGTFSNAKLDATNHVVLPVDTTEDFQTHFTSRSWADPQAQITAGYPIYVEPAASTGYYEELIDYTPGGSEVIAASTISVTLTSETINTGGTLVVSISYSADGSTYTPFVEGANQFISNFKYVKVRVVATGGLYTILALNIRLESKLKTFAGNVSCLATDSTGTIVYMTDDKTISGTKVFLDVDNLSIVLSPSVVSGVVPTAVYDFTDTVNPLSFKILLFNSQTGARLSGTCSYSVRGV